MHGVASEQLGKKERYHSPYDRTDDGEQESRAYSEHVACGELYGLSRQDADYHLDHLEQYYEQECYMTVLLQVINDAVSGILAEKAAAVFAKRCRDKGYEKGQSQQFLIDLLEHVYGIENSTEFISFEDIKRSDGLLLDPFHHAKHYVTEHMKIYLELTNK